MWKGVIFLVKNSSIRLDRSTISMQNLFHPRSRSSKVALDCWTSLNEVVWVPRHRHISGNCEESIDIRSSNGLLKEDILKKVNLRWKEECTYGTTRQICQSTSISVSKDLYYQNFCDFYRTLRLLQGNISWLLKSCHSEEE